MRPPLRKATSISSVCVRPWLVAWWLSERDSRHLTGGFQLTGQPGAEQVLGIEVHLRAEAPTEVRRYDAQQMFRNTDRLGDPSPVHMRHLTGQIDRHPAIDTRCRKNSTGFEAGRNEPVVNEAQLQQLVCSRAAAA